jgi:hypothetical protein
MRTNRKLLIVACAAIAVVALIFAIFSLQEDAKVPPPPSLERGATDASAGSRFPPATESPQLPSSETSSPADYFPLSDTFLLQYLVEVTDRGQKPRFGLARTAVEGRETIRGKEYYKVMLRVTGIDEMKDPVLRYCRMAGDAWHELDGSQKKDPAFEVITLPLPPRAGVTWDKDTPEERSNWKVEGTETVSLAGKSYPNCLRVAYERRLKHEPDYFETGHYFLAPGIGLIKQVATASGTRISFTLDQRSPEAIAFYTKWSGTYKGVSDRGPIGGAIDLFADGRFTLISPFADSRADVGRYERHPTREGEVIFRAENGDPIGFLSRTVRGPEETELRLKPVSQNEVLKVEYLRTVPNR